MNLNKNNFLSALLGLLYLSLSLILYGYYQLGDQEAYRAYWQATKHIGFLDSYYLLQPMLGTKEPGYAILAYVFSGVVPKDVLMSFINGLMGFFISHWLLRQKTPLAIIALVPFNFYILVLLFAAERLKLSVVFLLAAEYYGRHKLAWYALAICSHVSSLLLVLSGLANPVFQSARRLFQGYIKSSHLTMSVVGLGLGLVLAVFLGPHFVYKVQAYLLGSGVSWMGILKVGGLIVLACLYAKKKYQPIIAGLPIFIPAMLVGPDRLAMFAYFLFAFYAFQYRKGINLFNIIFIIYFLAKGVYFLEQVVVYKNGFFY